MRQRKQATNNNWGVYAALILMIVVAFVLRLINIEAFGFWTDEGLTPLRASYSISQIFRNDVIIQGVVTTDTHPALYYLVIHFTRQVLGETDFAYRFPSALAGVLLIPVMYQFGRRLQGVGLGMLAALLTAVNPLQIWYANEARMYTILVLLLALASYVLWRALSGASLLRTLAMYVTLAALAFYTHYTAVFLTAVQALFWVWLLWQHGQKKLIIGASVVGILAALPLIPFTIPRLFSGTEANFFYVSPQTMLQDVVRFFSLGMTVDYSQPGVKLLNGLAAGLLFLGIYAARTWKCRAFLLVYLLAVVFGLMVGSWLFKPMYQGVRHIITGSPAYILLTAWGIVFAWEQGGKRKKSRWAWAVVGSVSLLTVFAGSALALNNLYNHPEIYAKDDFRDLIAQMEARAGKNDVIVYNNAIHLPLHEHYRTRADVDVTAVPTYPTLASSSATPDLSRLAEIYDRIWFVTDPPADHRDDDGLTRQWLEENLVQVGENRAHARTTIVESLTFATAPTHVDSLPENGRSLNLHWSDLPTLHGIQLDSQSPVTQASLWFNLYWGGESTLPQPKLRFSLQDPNGQEWLSDIQPLIPGKDTPSAQTGLNQFAYQLALPVGLPPATYTLFAQPITQDNFTPLGEPQLLTELSLAIPPTAATWPENRRILFDNGLQLLGWHLGETTVRPGHNLPLTLYWQTDTPGSMYDLRYELAVVGRNGAVLRSQTDLPGAEWLTASPPNTPIMERTGLYFRPESEPGTYQLRWRLIEGEEAVPGRPFWQPWSRETITLGEITVVPWPLEIELPTDVIRTEAAFGPIDLYGYALDQTNPGQLTVTLHWLTQAAPTTNALLFVHLVDRDGVIVAQADRVPGNTLRPTGGWRENEVMSDTLTLTLPAELAPGSLHLRLGFYDPETGFRLPAFVADQPQANDQVEITTVTTP